MESSFIRQMKIVAQQDKVAFELNMAYRHFLKTNERFYRGQITGWGLAHPDVGNYIPIFANYLKQNNRLGLYIRNWLNQTPTMSMNEIAQGLCDIREFLGDEKVPMMRVSKNYIESYSNSPLTTWIHYEIRDMGVLYMARMLAPPSRRLNMAIRHLIMFGFDGKPQMIVPYISDYLCFELQYDYRTRLAFKNIQFRNDCKLAIAISSYSDQYFKKIKYLAHLMPQATQLAKRWPLLEHYVTKYEWPDSPTTYANLMGWQEQMFTVCAHIIGACV